MGWEDKTDMGSEGNHGLQESNVETGTYLLESWEGLISGTFWVQQL